MDLASYFALFMGGFFAAAISGSAGFGGALLLLPLLTKTIGATMAIPVLTIAQLLGNLSRIYFGYKEINWRPVLYFILGAVPLSIVGAYSFVSIHKETLTRIIGVVIILFVSLKYLNILKFKPENKTMLIGGIVSGLISGLAGSSGPIGAAVFLSLNLSPVSYIASEAVTAVVMHVTKTMVYQKYLGIGIDVIEIGLFVGVAMIGGTWVGKRVIEKLPSSVFTKLVSILLFLIGLEMLIWA